MNSIAASFISPLSLFGNYDDGLLTTLNNPVMRTAYEDFYVIPHNWTCLHLLAIIQPSSILQIPQYSDFRVLFLVDRYGKTPLHYLLSHNAINYKAAEVLLKYTIAYLEDKDRTIFEIKETSDSMTDILLFLLSRMNTKLMSQYLRLCSIETPTH